MFSFGGYSKEVDFIYKGKKVSLLSDSFTKKDALRVKGMYAFGRNVLGPSYLKIMDFHGPKYKMDNEPFLLYSNHTMNLDPGFQLCVINKYMRFIASDHLAEKAPIRKIMEVSGQPIIKHNEAPTSVVYNEVINTIRKGINVSISVESRKSNNGETGFISKKNAELAKDCGCKLITYRLSGGYFRTPRWAMESRKGPIYGEIVNIYSKEEIASMSVDEIYEHIVEDLYINAYEFNREKKNNYTCEHPAEAAEIILYCCPKCNQFATLHSKDDHIDCDCGFHATVDDMGFWHSDDLEFDDLVSWDRWQKSDLKQLCQEKQGTGELLFEDNDQYIYISKGNEKTDLSEEAHIALYDDRFELDFGDKNAIIYLDDIKKIDSNSKMTLLIVTQDSYYHIKSPKTPRSATKYVVAARYLMGKENN